MSVQNVQQNSQYDSIEQQLELNQSIIKSVRVEQDQDAFNTEQELITRHVSQNEDKPKIVKEKLISSNGSYQQTNKQTELKQKSPKIFEDNNDLILLSSLDYNAGDEIILQQLDSSRQPTIRQMDDGQSLVKQQMESSLQDQQFETILNKNLSPSVHHYSHHTQKLDSATITQQNYYYQQQELEIEQEEELEEEEIQNNNKSHISIVKDEIKLDHQDSATISQNHQSQVHKNGNNDEEEYASQKFEVEIEEVDNMTNQQEELQQNIVKEEKHASIKNSDNLSNHHQDRMDESDHFIKIITPSQKDSKKEFSLMNDDEQYIQILENEQQPYQNQSFDLQEEMEIKFSLENNKEDMNTSDQMQNEVTTYSQTPQISQLQQEKDNSQAQSFQEKKNSQKQEFPLIKRTEEASNDEVESFKQIFEVFDKKKAGVIKKDDLAIIIQGLGRDPKDLESILESLQISQKQLEFDFLMFLQIMLQLDSQIKQDRQRKFKKKVKILKRNNNQIINNKFVDYSQNNAQSHRIFSIEDRQKFGCLLPRSGVNCFPDQKVVDILSILQKYRNSCTKEVKVAEAKRAHQKLEDIKVKETIRQLYTMRSIQQKELSNIDNIQQNHMIELEEAWSQYMKKYEQGVEISINQLKERHQQEQEDLSQKIRQDFIEKNKGARLSKELLLMKKQVRVLCQLKQYGEAEKLRVQVDLKEKEEQNRLEEQIQYQIDKESERLRFRQNAQMNALITRIQRDRNEQKLHKQADKQFLLQRSKNKFQDLVTKQNAEARKTSQFLKYVLGVSSPEKLQSASKSFIALPTSNGFKSPSLDTDNQNENESFAQFNNYVGNNSKDVTTQLSGEKLAPQENQNKSYILQNNMYFNRAKSQLGKKGLEVTKSVELFDKKFSNKEGLEAINNQYKQIESYQNLQNLTSRNQLQRSLNGVIGAYGVKTIQVSNNQSSKALVYNKSNGNLKLPSIQSK